MTSIANAAAVDDAAAVSFCNAVRTDAITCFHNKKNGQTLRQQMTITNKEKDKGVRYIATKLLNTLTTLMSPATRQLRISATTSSTCAIPEQ
jgi:PhoPQ-activated pathogenicity-related protein